MPGRYWGTPGGRERVAARRVCLVARRLRACLQLVARQHAAVPAGLQPACHPARWQRRPAADVWRPVLRGARHPRLGQAAGRPHHQPLGHLEDSRRRIAGREQRSRDSRDATDRSGAGAVSQPRRTGGCLRVGYGRAHESLDHSNRRFRYTPHHVRERCVRRCWPAGLVAAWRSDRLRPIARRHGGAVGHPARWPGTAARRTWMGAGLVRRRSLALLLAARDRTWRDRADSDRRRSSGDVAGRHRP